MIFKLHYLHISRYSVPLHRVFHSIRFKVNKGWSTDLCIVFFIVLDLRLTKVGVQRYSFFMPISEIP